MSHSNEHYPFNLHSDDELKRLLNEIHVDPAPTGELGPTGHFPDGKIADNDEGGVNFGITAIGGRLIIDFGNPIRTIGFTRGEAVNLANYLFDKARTL